MTTPLRIAIFVRYAGGVIKHNNAYEVVIRIGGKLRKKSFAILKYGEAQAKELAETARREMSDRFGFTIRVYIKSQPIAVMRWLAGFLDGDGSIGFTNNFQSRVRFFQSQNSGQPPVLTFIQSKYGGSIRIDRDSTDTQRTYHVLEFIGFDCIQVLYDVIPFLIIKRERAILLCNYLRGKSHLSKYELYERFKSLLGVIYYTTVSVPPEKVTVEYLAGLFDAEGSIGCPEGISITVSITQRSSVSLLNRIRDLFGGSVVYNQQLVLRSENAMILLSRIHPYTIVKRKQIDYTLELRDYTNVYHKDRDHADKVDIERLRGLITSDKYN